MYSQTHTRDDTSVDLPQLVAIRDVPSLRWLPRRPGNRKYSLNTIWRWALHGQRGVKLRTVRVGGTLCTSEIWLSEYFESLAAQDQPTAHVRTPAVRRRAIEEAEQQNALTGIS